MLEFVEGGFDISGDGEGDSAIFVVPFEVDAAVSVALPIGGDGIVLRETVNEVLGIRFVNIFDAEVVNNKGEVNWSGLVGP